MVSACAVIVLVCAIVHRLAKWQKKLETASFVEALLVVASFLIHPYLCSRVFQAFECTQVGTRRFLTSSLTIDCDSRHHRTAQAVAAFAMIVFAFGIPVAWYHIAQQQLAKAAKQQGREHHLQAWR